MSSKSGVIKTIVFLGNVGSGKGTQAELLSEKLNYKILNTGKVFRELRQKDTPLGKRVREVYDSGDLLPDWFPMYLFKQELFQLGENDGLILDGAVRTLGQAQEFDEVLDWSKRDYAVIDVQVSEDEVVNRMQKRDRDTLDSDDNIKVRLEEYEKKTAPAIKFFKERGKVLEINGEQARGDVFTDICKVLNID